MEVFVPVSAVAAPNTQAREATPKVVGAAENAPKDASTMGPLVDFLQDHIVQGTYQGGQLALELIRTIQSSADESKNELVRNLPTMGRRLLDVPTAWRALFSEDPTTIRALERQFAELSRDVASATGTGVLYGLSRLAGTAMPFTVAAGAVLGAAVGGERIHTLVQFARETIKEE